MKNSHEIKYLSSEIIASGMARGRAERARAFHNLWKAATRAIR